MINLQCSRPLRLQLYALPLEVQQLFWSDVLYIGHGYIYGRSDRIGICGCGKGLLHLINMSLQIGAIPDKGRLKVRQSPTNHLLACPLRAAVNGHSSGGKTNLLVSAYYATIIWG